MDFARRVFLKLHFSRKVLFHTRGIDTRKAREYSSNFIKIIEISLMFNAGLYQMSSVSIMNLIFFLDVRLESV